MRLECRKMPAVLLDGLLGLIVWLRSGMPFTRQEAHRSIPECRTDESPSDAQRTRTRIEARPRRGDTQRREIGYLIARTRRGIASHNCRVMTPSTVRISMGNGNWVVTCDVAVVTWSEVS